MHIIIFVFPPFFFNQLNFVSLHSFLQIPGFSVLFAAVRFIFFLTLYYLFLHFLGIYEKYMLILDEF